MRDTVSVSSARLLPRANTDTSTRCAGWFDGHQYIVFSMPTMSRMAFAVFAAPTLASPCLGGPDRAHSMSIRSLHSCFGGPHGGLQEDEVTQQGTNNLTADKVRSMLSLVLNCTCTRSWSTKAHSMLSFFFFLNYFLAMYYPKSEVTSRDQTQSSSR